MSSFRSWRQQHKTALSREIVGDGILNGFLKAMPWKLWDGMANFIKLFFLCLFVFSWQHGAHEKKNEFPLSSLGEKSWKHFRKSLFFYFRLMRYDNEYKWVRISWAVQWGLCRKLWRLSGSGVIRLGRCDGGCHIQMRCTQTLLRETATWCTYLSLYRYIFVYH